MTYIKISFYNFLDLSGLYKQDGVQWVYYTHLGKKWRIPLSSKQRGPSVQDHMLSVFLDNPALEEQLRGPNGDYHGMLPRILSLYKLSFDIPPITLMKLMFRSTKEENRAYFNRLVINPEFQSNFVELLTESMEIYSKVWPKFDNRSQALIEELDGEMKWNERLPYVTDMVAGLAKHIDKIPDGQIVEEYPFLRSFFPQEKKPEPEKTEQEDKAKAEAFYNELEKVVDEEFAEPDDLPESFKKELQEAAVKVYGEQAKRRGPRMTPRTQMFTEQEEKGLQQEFELDSDTESVSPLET